MTNAKPPNEIFGEWVHSNEEDTEGLKVYRRKKHMFPPSRGRPRFTIKESGEFIHSGISPGDAIQMAIGCWKMEDDNCIKVYFGSEKNPAYSLTIVSCSKDILKIKK